jgi:hypothetical protein
MRYEAVRDLQKAKTMVAKTCLPARCLCEWQHAEAGLKRQDTSLRPQPYSHKWTCLQKRNPLRYFLIRFYETFTEEARSVVRISCFTSGLKWLETLGGAVVATWQKKRQMWTKDDLELYETEKLEYDSLNSTVLRKYSTF